MSIREYYTPVGPFFERGAVTFTVNNGLSDSNYHDVSRGDQRLRHADFKPDRAAQIAL